MHNLRIFLLLLISTCIHPGSLLAQGKPLPAEYVFKLGITYAITNGKTGETPRNMETTFWLSDKDYSGFVLPQQPGMMMIYDLPNKQMVTFMEDNKMAMIMDMKQMERKMDSINKKQSNPANANDVKIVKTGKTEKILGYTCEQYQVNTKGGNTLVWVTKELGAGMGNFAQSLSQLMKGNPSGQGIPDLKSVGNGVMLKMESTTTDSGTTTKMEAKSINKDGKTISTAGYNVMKMPGT